MTSNHRQGPIAFAALFLVVLVIEPLYIYGVGMGFLPQIAGAIGGLKALCALAVVAFIGPARLAFSSSNVARGTYVFLSLVILMILAARVFGTWYVGAPFEDIIRTQSLHILNAALLFLIGWCIAQYGNDSTPLIGSWAIFAVCMFLNIDWSTAQVATPPFGTETFGIFQRLGDAFAIISILLIARLDGGARALVTALSFGMLFLLGSRASLYAFAFALAFAAFFQQGTRGRIANAALILGMFLMFGILVMTLAPGAMGSRMLLSVVQGTDTSLLFRQQQLGVGLQDIVDNIFFGNLGGDWRFMGRSGDYIHNYLEIWRQFGVIPFIMFNLVLLNCWLWYWNRSQIEGGIRPGLLAAAMLGAFATVELLTSRSWGTPWIFGLFGYVALMSSERESEEQRRG